jgi:hypothetical protein
MPATYTQDREKHTNAPAAATAQLGDKLPVVMTCTADRIRASLILCPAR